MWSPVSLLNVFTAGQISTSISSAECVDLRSPAGDAHQRLTSLRFDQAPVVDQAHVVGWVATSNLATVDRVKAVLRPLALSAIVSKEASIADVLQLLAGNGLVFTVDERGIHGFVTSSDLERHAARSHFYLLITGIEMLLAQIVSECVDDSVIIDRLENESRERWERDFDDDDETNPAEYLYLRDLADLFLELPVATPKRGWEPRLSNLMTQICQFRPSVMHANRPLCKGRSAAQLASLARGAEEVTARLDEIAIRLDPGARRGA